MSTIALAPVRPSVRRPGTDRGRPAHPSRPAQRRPVGVRPPRVTFVEPETRACRVLSPARPLGDAESWLRAGATRSAGSVAATGWHLTTRGVGVVVSLTGAVMSVALVAMVLRFLAVTAG